MCYPRNASAKRAVLRVRGGEVSEQHRVHVNKLAFPHHASAAYRALLRSGLDALPAVREGLCHESADVRYRCCQFLDHFLAAEVIDDLATMLNDPDPRVRCSILHTLACDRCKEGSCRPEEAKVLPHASALLANDPNPHVRAMAIEVVGRWVHTNPRAEAALLRAKASDSSSTVRKKAGWYAPEGTIYRRTVPRVRKAVPGQTNLSLKTDAARDAEVC
jgi:HEAT repeat protein